MAGITLGTALLGSALVGGTVAGSAMQASAAKKAGKQVAQATDEATALNREIYQQTRADNEYARQVGNSAMGALAQGFGLPVSMTGSAPANANTAPAGVSMTGGATSPATPPKSSLPGAIGAASTAMQQQAPAQGGFSAADLAAIRQDWPGIEQEFNRVRASADPNSPQFQQVGADSLDNFTRAWYDQRRNPADYTYTPPQTAAPAQPATLPATSNGTPAGYNDPTAPNGYTPGPAPAAYVSPQRQEFRPLDVSLSSFRESPDYQFRVQEGNRALDSLMSSMGGVMSGRRVKASLERNQNLADAEYTDWRDYTTGQYNLDRSRNDTIYEADRGFGYGLSRDARGDFETDRGYTTSRYDTRNNTLMGLAGFGTGATAANANAAQSFANNNANLTMTGAQARGGAAQNAANAWSSGLNGLMTAGAYMYGARK